jgi:hypothetical protein
VLARPVDAVEDVAERDEARVVGDLDRHQRRVRGDARHAFAVVGLGEDGAGDVGPVTDLVADVAVVPDHVARIDDRDAVEVGMGQVHARIDHRHHHGGVAAGRLPGLGDVDLGEVGLLGIVGVGRVAVVRPVEQRQLRVGHDGQDARVGAEGAREGRGLARLGGHDGPPRALHGRGRRHAGDADRGRGDALPDDDETALVGLGVRGPAGSHGAGGARRGRDPEHERRREQQRDARPGRHRAPPSLSSG